MILKIDWAMITLKFMLLAHSNNEEEAKIFLEEIKKEIPNAKDYYIDHLSLSVSCHIGPGSLAIALCKDLD